jgi:hypothetical protein
MSLGCAWAGLLFDLLSLDLMFVAVRYQPGFGPLAAACSAANVVSTLPVTPGGLGVAEVTLMAITVGFGAPANRGPRRARLPAGELLASAASGVVACLRLRLSRKGPDQTRPSMPRGTGPVNQMNRSRHRLGEASGRAGAGRSCPTPAGGDT